MIQDNVLFKKIGQINDSVAGCIALASFLLFYGLLLWPRIYGAGQYWDLSFPYFQSQIKNFFSNQSFSWSSVNGSALQYSSDYYFRFIISRFSFLRPELLLYFLCLFIFVIGSFGLFCLIKGKTGAFVAMIFSLATFVNPGIFCLYLAGYIDDLASFVIFIYLLYFLFCFFKPDFKGYVITGLFLSFVGIALQFYVLTAIFLALFFIFNPTSFRLKYFPILVCLPILINLPWLSNIIAGGTSIGGISAVAATGQNLARSSASLLQIFNFSFSPTTLISQYYSPGELIFFIFLPILFFMSVLGRKQSAKVLLFLLSLIFFIFLGIGAYRDFLIWPIDILYPMFREMEHIIPCIILFFFLAWSQVKTSFRYAALPILIVFIFLNVLVFVRFSDAINYSNVRDDFSEFQSFISNNPTITNDHVLTYPFWGQYGFLDVPQAQNNSFRLNNTGYDSYMIYSGLNRIENALSPDKVLTSLQYQLLTTLDLANITPFGVKYIFDFSNIYESYYDQYVASESYDGDLSIIKDNPDFVAALSKANPGEMEQISPHIYEILDTRPFVSSFTNLFEVPSSTTASELAAQFPNRPSEPFYFMSNTGNNIALPAEGLTVDFRSNDHASSSISTSSILENPASITFQRVNPTKTIVQIKGAGTSFFLALAENYNDKWQLQINNNKVSGLLNSWWPFVSPDRVSDSYHYQVDSSLNAWYVNTKLLCQVHDWCTANRDGTYDISMVIEFWPQRLMYLSLIISIMTMCICLGYFIVLLGIISRKRNTS